MAKQPPARPNVTTGGSAIVSSAHLAAGAAPSLSEFEYGLILAGHAFNRWMVRCMAAAGMPDLSPVEVLILHSVRHRARPKKLADIALVLDIEEMHLVTYAVRKLTAAGLVQGSRAGKDKLVVATQAGADLCDRYHTLREAMLVRAVSEAGPDAAALSDLARHLRALSGFYVQSARAAATL